MAAILQLRRAASASPSLTDGEIFLNYSTGTIQFASGSTPVVSNLLPLNKSINGTIILDGNITASTLTITGETQLLGNLTLGGSFIKLGNEGTDEIEFVGLLSGSLIPDTGSTYDIGSTGAPYNHIYVVSASIDNISLPGSNIVSSSQQISDYNVFLEIQGDSVVSGSSQIDITQTTNYESGIKTRLNVETVISGSSQIDALGFLQVNGDNVISGSSQVEIDEVDGFTSYSSSVDSRLDSIQEFTSSIDTTIKNKLDLDGVISGSIQILGGSNILSSSVSNFTDYSSSVDSRVDSLESFSSSLDLSLGNLEATGSDHESRIDGLETYTGSNDTLNTTQNNRLISLETYTGSNDLNVTELFSSASQYESFSSSIDTTIKTKINIEGVFSSSAQVDADDITNFDTNVKDTLDAEGVISGSSQVQIDSVTGFTSYSSSVDGRLNTIEGSFSTSVDSRLDNIEDYTSSLKQAIDVSGQDLTIYGNLIVQGETTTLNTTELLIEDKVLAIASGSTTSVEADGGGIYISGADASMTWNHTNQLLEFNTKVSSSIGFKGDGSELENIDYNGIVFDGSGLVSGSSQINISGSSDYTESIKTRLDAEGVISGSSQVDADSIANFDSNVDAYLVSEDVHRGSDLGTATTTQLTEGTNLYYTNERVKTKLNAEGVFSSSAQVDADDITNFDTNVKDTLDAEGVISGSSQVQIDSVTGFTSYSSSVDSRLDVIDNLNLYTQSNDLRVNSIESFTESIDTRVGDLEFTGSNHENRIYSLESFSSSLDNEFLNTNGDGVFSSSIQVDVFNTDGFDGFSSSIDTRLYSLETDQHTHSNKSQLDTINQNLSNSDSPTFNSLTLTNLTNDTSNLLLQGVLYSSSGELVYSDFGDVIYYNVSQSIGFEDDDVIGTAGAMKRYIDAQFIAVGAGDITEVLAGSGLSGGAFTGSATLTLDTGSTHFIDGVNGVVQLGDGIVSSSSQISAYNIFAELNGDGLVSGSSQIQLNLVSGFITFSSSVDSRLDSLESFSSSLDDDFVTQTELASATGSLINSIATKLDTGSYNTDSQSFDLRLNDLESTASNHEIRIDNIESFSSSIDDTIETKLNIEGVISGSSQVVLQNADKTGFTGASSITTLGTVTSGNVTAILPSGTVSGSSQITPLLPSGTISGSSQVVYTSISSIPSGIVSGSSQVNADSITNFDTNVKAKLDADLVVSGSASSVKSFLSLDNVTNESKATMFSSPTFTGTVSGVSATHVGLGNVTNESKATMFTNAALTGNPTAPTQTGSDDSTKIATTAFVQDRIDAIIGTAGSTLDTLGELSSSLAQDSGSLASLVTTVGGKLQKDQNLSDLTDVAQARTNLGVDVAGTDNSTDVTLAGSYDYLTISGQVITRNQIDASTDISNLNTTNVSEGTRLYYTDTRVKTKLNAEGVISGSTGDQLTGSFDSRYLNTNGNGVVSGSGQLTDMTGDITVNSSGVSAIGSGVIVNADVNASAAISYTKLNLSGSGIVSGSSQIDVTSTTNYSSINQYSDTKVKNKLNADTVVSQSVQIDHDSTTGFVANEHIDHSTVTITAGDGLTGGGTIAATRTLNVVGTAGRISVSADAVDIDSTYVGQSTITTLGTITTGSWNGSVIGSAYLDSDTAHLSGTQTFTGAKTFSNSTASTTTTTGAVIVTGGVGIGGALNVGGDVVAFSSSDRRLKDEITPIQNSLQKINSIGGYSFVWNENQHIYKGKDYGVIAQEIEQILPELVETRENGYKAVKYDRIVSLLIEGIKELSKEVSELKEKIGK